MSFLPHLQKISMNTWPQEQVGKFGWLMLFLVSERGDMHLGMREKKSVCAGRPEGGLHNPGKVFNLTC